MRVDFGALLQKQCVKADFEDWNPAKNHVDPRLPGCTLGLETVYARRKGCSLCYNGQSFYIYIYIFIIIFKIPRKPTGIVEHRGPSDLTSAKVVLPLHDVSSMFRAAAFCNAGSKGAQSPINRLLVGSPRHSPHRGVRATPFTAL